MGHDDSQCRSGILGKTQNLPTPPVLEPLLALPVCCPVTKSLQLPPSIALTLFSFRVALRPNAGHGLLILEVSRSHKQRRITVGRTPLDEWSAHRRDLYLTTHNTHNRQTSMPPGGIRTHNLSRLAAADPCLRPRGHWNRHRPDTIKWKIQMAFLFSYFLGTVTSYCSGSNSSSLIFIFPTLIIHTKCQISNAINVNKSVTLNPWLEKFATFVLTSHIKQCLLLLHYPK